MLMLGQALHLHLHHHLPPFRLPSPGTEGIPLLRGTMQLSTALPALRRSSPAMSAAAMRLPCVTRCAWPCSTMRELAPVHSPAQSSVRRQAAAMQVLQQVLKLPLPLLLAAAASVRQANCTVLHCPEARI